MLKPEPEQAPLSRVFDHVYLTADASFWRLSAHSVVKSFVLNFRR
jgi:hypothetical protein